MYVARDVDLSGMLNPVMCIAVFFQSVITGELIGENCARREDVLLYQTRESIGIHVGSGFRNHTPFAFYDSDNGGFLFVALSGPSAVALAPSTHVSFVHLNTVALRA